jgi:V8-like Glu-specific endopeptidase
VWYSNYDTSAYPYDTVVHISDTIGGEPFVGSGVLISPDEVLTASHVVYAEGIGTAADIVVTPGYQVGYSPYGSAQGTVTHYFPIHDANDLIPYDQSQYDYAIIHLSSPFADAGTMGIESNFGGGAVSVTGYPVSAGGTQVDSQQTVTLDPVYTLLDGTSLGPGSSGGPVWIETGVGPDVVGIVSSGNGSTGHFTAITTSAFNQIETWLAQDAANTTGPAVTETFYATQPNETFEGPNGVNTVIFSGSLNQYTITQNPGSISIADTIPGRDGTDTLNNIQQAKFTDYTVVFDLNSAKDKLV